MVLPSSQRPPHATLPSSQRPPHASLPPFSYHLSGSPCPFNSESHFPFTATNRPSPHTSTCVRLRGAQRDVACDRSTSRGAREQGGTYPPGWGTSLLTIACRSWRSIRPACTKSSRYWNRTGRVRYVCMHKRVVLAGKWAGGRVLRVEGLM